jgi:hypothetical protein
MTAREPANREQRTARRTVLFNRIGGVHRARRLETARASGKRRETQLIGSDSEKCES